MPSNDNKGTEKSSKKDVTFKTKQKKKVNAGFIFGMIVLILIAISFVFAPAIGAIAGGSTSNGLSFGSYDGEDIVYAQDSYLYDMYQQIGSQYDTSSTSGDMALYNIWKSAFDSTVYHTAITKMAESVGYKTTEEAVNNAIINSGYYNEDGVFSRKVYEETTAVQKENIRKNITRDLPYNTVLSDLGTVLTSDSETDYVASMADTTRSFEYVVFDYDKYPRESAAQYALNNPQLFYNIDLSIITVETEEDAISALDKSNSGTSFNDVATESSLDSYAADGGVIGSVPFYAIKNNFKEASEATQILDGSEGSIYGPLEATSGWAIYKLNATPKAADYTDEETLLMIKAYIASNDSSVMDEYLLGLANDFVSSTVDFETSATDNELTVYQVGATAKNISGSQYMSSLSYSDTTGVLASAASDEETLKSLFSSEVGSIMDPIKVSSAYVVVNVKDESSDSGMGEYLKSVYPYYASQHNATDLQYSIMASDKLENNFMSVFLENILVSSN